VAVAVAVRRLQLLVLLGRAVLVVAAMAGCLLDCLALTVLAVAVAVAGLMAPITVSLATVATES
jgi:hypothetical protein